MQNKIWRFRSDMLGQYINTTTNLTFQKAEDRLNNLELLKEQLEKYVNNIEKKIQT